MRPEPSNTSADAPSDALSARVTASGGGMEAQDVRGAPRGSEGPSAASGPLSGRQEATGDRVSPQETASGVRDVQADNELRRAVAVAIHRYDHEHGLSGNPYPSRHHKGEADAVLDALEQHLDIGEEQAWCKICRRVWEGRSHRCEGDAEANLAALRTWLSTEAAICRRNADAATVEEAAQALGGMAAGCKLAVRVIDGMTAGRGLPVSGGVKAEAGAGG